MHDNWLGWFTPWWPDFSSFLRMGRHGSYVWGSVALTLAALGLEWVLLRRRAAKLGQTISEALESGR
jgi:heme exporter protein CcmD